MQSRMKSVRTKNQSVFRPTLRLSAQSAPGGCAGIHCNARSELARSAPRRSRELGGDHKNAAAAFKHGYLDAATRAITALSCHDCFVVRLFFAICSPPAARSQSTTRSAGGRSQVISFNRTGYSRLLLARGRI